MKIRIAEYEDIATISNVLAASWKSAYRGIVTDDYLNLLPNNHWVEFLTTGLDNGNIFAMVLANDHHMIGTAIIGQEQHKNTASLISFYLLPDKIGQGFGHAFYECVEDEMKRKGFAKCVLDVLEKNMRAKHFYETHGFTKTNKTVKTTLGNGEYLCEVYEKPLS